MERYLGRFFARKEELSENTINKQRRKRGMNMGWLNNLKVAQRLVLLILVFVVALVGVGGTGYFYLKKTSDAMDAMYREKMHAVELILENRIHMRRI